MDITANGLQDDGIFLGELTAPGTPAVVTQVGPADGDIDNGDAFLLVTSGPGAEINGLEIVYSGRDDSVATIESLARTKVSAATPTQGSCSFVGNVIVSD
jgi:hypothetical protein